jgi:hypothetical protein
METRMKGYACLLLMLVLPVLVRAQITEKKSETPFTAKGAFFALAVADLDSSAKWYLEKFDLEVVFRTPKHSSPLSKAAQGIKERTLIQGVTKTGLIVDNFDKTHAALRDVTQVQQTGWWGLWFGLDPADAPLLLRDAGAYEIYSLTLDRE